MAGNSRHRKRTLYLASEVTPGVDPSPDGSGYFSVPIIGLGELEDTLEHIPTNYFTGRLASTVPLPGAEGTRFTFGIPLIGNVTGAPDNASPPADDWLDIILNHMFGIQETHTGESVTGSTVGDVTLDAGGGRGLNDLAVVWDPALLFQGGQRSQWTKLVTAGPTNFQVEPDFVSAPAGQAFGVKQYQFQDCGGPSFSAVYVDDQVGTYRMGLGRITAFAIEGTAGQPLQATGTMEFVGVIEEDAAGKTALPPSIGAPAITPLILTGSPYFFGGANFSTAQVNIDFGIEAAPVLASESPNGRVGNDAIRMEPTITVRPLRTEANRLLRKNLTVGEALVQLGAGILNGGGVLNTMAINFGATYASEVRPEGDEGGNSRQQIVFRAVDAGAAPAVHFQVARA